MTSRSLSSTLSSKNMSTIKSSFLEQISIHKGGNKIFDRVAASANVSIPLNENDSSYSLSHVSQNLSHSEGWKFKFNIKMQFIVVGT